MGRKQTDSNSTSRNEPVDRDAARKRPATAAPNHDDRVTSRSQPKPASERAADFVERPAQPAGFAAAEKLANVDPHGSDRAIDASIGGSGASTEYATTEALKRGLAGERLAAEALNQQGHKILDYKPDIRGTNQGGIDIVTIKDGVVYFIDNKAYGTGRNVGSVSALQANFERNVAAIREKFDKFANDPTRSESDRKDYAAAVEAIDNDRSQKAVTTAAVVPDGRASQGVTAGLQKDKIIHIDVGPEATRKAIAERQARTATGPERTEAPVAVENGFRPPELSSRNAGQANGDARSEPVPAAIQDAFRPLEGAPTSPAAARGPSNATPMQTPFGDNGFRPSSTPSPTPSTPPSPAAQPGVAGVGNTIANTLPHGKF